MKGRNRPRVFRSVLSVFLFLAAVVFSGCLWGVVRDAETGNPLPGVTVNYTDANGNTGSAVTNANGMYVIDQKYVQVPAAGPISFQISEPGFDPLTAARLIQYDDNPGATVADLSSFWEVQNFDLVPEMVQRIEVELRNVDVDHVAGMPSGGIPISWLYFVSMKAYDPADLAVPVCEQSSGGDFTTAGDPPPVVLNYDCNVVGEDFRLVVTVTLLRQYQVILPVPHVVVLSDASTAAYDWIAPSSETSWEYETIDSSDATGPDSAAITFEAQIRFRSVLGRAMVSDVNAKEGFAAIDRAEILRKLVALPITSWSYIGEPGVRHVGPMAQDFHAAFGLGDSDRRIEVVDAIGVAFAAIQELHEKLVEKDRQIAALQRQVADLTARVAALEAKLAR